LRSCFQQDTTHKLNAAVVAVEAAVEVAAPWEQAEAALSAVER
jgi:hypothetical protein